MLTNKLRRKLIQELICDARRAWRPESGSYVPIVMNPPSATYPTLRVRGNHKVVVSINPGSREDVTIRVDAYHTEFPPNAPPVYSDPIAISPASQSKFVRRRRHVTYKFDIDTSSLAEDEVITFYARATEHPDGPPTTATLKIFAE